MKIVLILGLSLLVNFTKTHASDNSKLEDNIDFKTYSKASSVSKDLSQKCFLSSEKKGDDSSLEIFKKTRKFLIGNKFYGFHINDNLKKRLDDKIIQLELTELIRSLQEKIPSERTVGFSFSYSFDKNKVYASPYLGLNAK